MHSDPPAGAPSPRPPQVYEGRYSDGRSAGSRVIQLRLGARGVEIKLPGNEPVLTWPYDRLKTSVPLSRNVNEVLLSLPDQPGATLFVPKRSFVQDLVVRAPHLTARSERWKYTKPLLALFAAVVGIGVLIQLLDLSPARAIARALPKDTRVALGKQVLASITKDHKVCSTPAGDAALARMVERLSRAEGGKHQFRVQVVDWRLVNAFAVPGEQIILTRGLLTQAGSPDEVAGVLAHEMGHGIETHPETGFVRAVGISLALEILFTGSSAGTIANTGAFIAQLSYTRAAEREADTRGLELLRNAGISAKPLAVFFDRISGRKPTTPAAGPANPGDAKKDETKKDEAKKVEPKGKNNRRGPTLFDILSTHPPSVERAEMIRKMGDYPATPSLSDEDWKALREICGPPTVTPAAPATPPAPGTPSPPPAPGKSG